MRIRVRTAISLLVCVMMLLTQFAFALDEGGANAGAEAADHAAAASEAVNEDTVPEEGITEVKNAEPVIEETGHAVKAAEPAGEEAEPVDNVKEASGEETRPAEKEGSTPAFSSETELDGVIVSVKAAEGVFPEGANLSVEKVSDAEQKKVDKAVDAARDDDLNVAVAYSFDVKVLDRDGEVVQPADNNTVEVSFELDEADDVNLDATVYHLDDTEKGLRAEELRSETANDTVSAVTDGFSYYTVEFTYGGLQYVMDGNSSVALADILGKVGLEGEASDVSVSNDKLFSAEKKAGKWMVTAHRAFTSEEWMKVTIDGVVYEIVVTDAVPDSNVTSEVQMAANDLKDGNFTIGNGGVVLGPSNGTATIKNGTVTNNAVNSRKDGYSSTNGSAFVAQGANSLQFNDVTIKSGANTLVFNIWQNCSITAENTTLNGSTNSSIDVPFLMIGGYSNGGSGTLNFEGTSDIDGAKGSIIGSSNGSVINVNDDGTLTINNSEIVLENEIKLIANSGASLIVKGTTELTGTKPTIKSGATLDITSSGKYTLDNVGSSFDFEEGAILKVNSYEISEVIVNNGEKVTISGTGDIAKEGGWNISRKIGNKNVTIKANEVTVVENAPVTVKSGGGLTFDNVTLAERSNITIESGGKAWLKGTNTFTDCEIVNSGSICVAGTSAEIKDSSLTFSGNSGLIKVEAGKALTIDPTTIKPTRKQQVQVWGTFNLEETEVDLSQNGAIRWIRIEDGGTANISKSTLSGSTSLGVIRANSGSTLKIDKSIFKNNKAAGSGEQNNGGVILAWGSDITITDSIFTGNSAAAGGGVIWQDNTTLSVDGESKFTDNIANSRGGAIFAGNSSVTIGDGVTFEGNRAGSDTTTATGNGGALYLDKSATFIEKAAFVKNGTYLPPNWEEEGFDPKTGIYTQSGGAINASEGVLNIEGTSFTGNIALMWDKAQGSGGAIHVTGTTMTISGAAFEDNAGQLYGGAVSLGMKSKAYVNDLNGKPTMFTGNAVLYGAEFAGGAICIHGDGTAENDALLEMENAAIYNNYADGAGGGISTCQQGTSKVQVIDGAAVYNNTVGDGTPVSNAKNYSDIYIFRNGTVSQDDSELYERMFNGGLHNWKDKTVNVREAWAQPHEGKAKIAGSNPTNKNISKAKVIFTGNKAMAHPLLEGAVASGGAISNNGLLQIGSMAEIKILKLWDDKADSSARPGKEEFLKKLTILANGEEVSKDGLTIDVITKDVDKYVLFHNIVDDDGEAADFGDKTPWLIIVSGLPKKTETGDIIKYTIKEGSLSNYRLVKEEGDIETYFRLENKVQLVDIPVRKVWDEEDKYTGLRPKEITVSLLADGKKVRELKLNESNKWSGTFRDLVRYNGDKEIRYTVEEAGDENLSYYTCKITGDASSGFTITNRLEVYTAGETCGIKTWKGDDDVLKKRPSEIVVNLLADGKVFKTVTASKANGWRIEFGHIPEYRDGKKISYTIEEAGVKEYKASYNGFNITNTYTGVKPDSSRVKGTDTGDDSPVAPLIVLIAACTAGITGIALRRRKRDEE